MKTLRQAAKSTRGVDTTAYNAIHRAVLRAVNTALNERISGFGD